jgi:IMP cyclohydrolase
MLELNLNPSPDTLEANVVARSELTYVGREIWMMVVGERVVQLSGLSGRSEPSRMRAYRVGHRHTVRTLAPGKMEEEMQAVPDSDLIYYIAQEDIDGVHVVSNGAQTPWIAQWMVQNKGTFEEAVRSAPKVQDSEGRWVDLSSYEPDPLTTPRIAGVVDLKGRESFGLSILRKAPESFRLVQETWGVRYGLSRLPDGVGYGIRTYDGKDGSTEPFTGEPYALPLPDTAESIADMYIETTNRENFVGVAVREIDRRTGAVRFVIRNAYE